MDKYKSWSDLKKQLENLICGELQGRISFFLTRYHKVHNSYGRAAILLDKREIINFSWIEMYRQENDRYISCESEEALKKKWDRNCTYCDMDFLDAALSYKSMSIEDALNSDDYIISILAILDRRVGKRTLERIKSEQKYKNYPDWAKYFYELRLSVSL